MTQKPLSDASKALIQTGRDYYSLNYKPRDMILDHGKGARVWDLDGNDYVDLGAGIAVCSLGHQDPDLLNAMETQMRKLWHTSNIFFTEPAIKLSEALVKHSGFAKRAYLCNSGAEANEAAIKTVRKFAANNGRNPEHREIITFKGSFHGRTLAAVTATAQPKYHEGYEPLPGGFVYCEEFNNEASIEALVTEKTAAIMLEPVQGEGGIVPSKPGFLTHLRSLCDKVGALLVLDQVQCGMGRTGKLFSHMHEEVVPDIVTVAKALGGGVPIGATLFGEKVEETLNLGSHGSTYGGNPIMSAVALASLTKIADPALLKDVIRKGELLRSELENINKEFGIFKEVRGRGLMIGAELIDAHAGKAGDISEAARKAGVLVLVAGPNVSRFLPPLTITDEELKDGMLRFRNGIASYLGN